MSGIRRREFLVYSALSSIFMSSVSTQEHGTDTEKDGWRKYAGNLRNTSYAPLDEHLVNPDTRWIHETCAQVLSSPSVADGRAYFGSDDGYVYALNAETGATRWRKRLDGPVDSSPAVSNGRLYIGTRGNSMYALDASTGDEIWRFGTGWWVRSSPAVTDGLVYFGSFDGNLYALDSVTGEEVWKYAVGEKVYASPAVHDGRVYVGGFGNSVHAVGAEDGEGRWWFGTDATVGGSPAITDGTVYVLDRRSNLYALSAEMGDALWVAEGDAQTGSSPAVDGERVYICRGNDIVAFNGETGNEVWSHSTEEPIYASNPLATEAAVYTGADDGYFRALQPETGELLWRYDIGDTVRSLPAPYDGRLYFGSYDSNLYALEEEPQESDEVTRDCSGTSSAEYGEQKSLVRDTDARSSVGQYRSKYFVDVLETLLRVLRGFG